MRFSYVSAFELYECSLLITVLPSDPCSPYTEEAISNTLQATRSRVTTRKGPLGIPSREGERNAISTHRARCNRMLVAQASRSLYPIIREPCRVQTSYKTWIPENIGLVAERRDYCVKRFSLSEGLSFVK